MNSSDLPIIVAWIDYQLALIKYRDANRERTYPIAKNK